MALSTRVRIGIGGWNFAPWRGSFYPRGLPQAQELAFASRQLGSIEINATFYRTQTADTFGRWAAETPQDFVFSVKAHRLTTHRKLLADARPSIETFLDSGVLALGAEARTDPLAVRVDQTFDAADFAAFLESLPRQREGRRLRHVVEVRHASFCTPAFVDLLRRHDVAVCTTDSPKFPRIADLCADFVYARLQRAEASYKAGYAPRELDRWAERIRTWEEGGAPADLPRISAGDADRRGRDCFIYMIDGAKEKAPAAARALIERLAPHEPPGE